METGIDIEELFLEFKQGTGLLGSESASEWMRSKKESWKKYRDLFNPNKLEKLTKEGFKSFLRFENNKSWTGLHRRGWEATEDMDKLRHTIAFLQDETVDIKTRINGVLGKDGEYSIRGMGKNLATAILIICDEKDEYCVWNNRVENALDKLGLIPDHSGDYAEYYSRINQVLSELKVRLNTDMAHIDSFMWYIDENLTEEETGEVSRKGIPVGVESDLIRFLADRPSLIETGLILKGREYQTDVGRIDLLLINGKNNFVIIETKKGRESDKVVGQISRYMGYVRRKMARPSQDVRGIILCNEFDEKLDYAVAAHNNLSLKYYQIKFELFDSPL